MRRSEKQITDRFKIEKVIRESTLCRLAMCDAGRPYIVPLSFGYRDDTLYFHSAQQGRKVDILRKNAQVCFEFDLGSQVNKSDDVCNWGVIYRSVIGSGRVFFIEELDAKREALAIIVEHYGGAATDLPLNAVNKTLVFGVRIDEISGKQSFD